MVDTLIKIVGRGKKKHITRPDYYPNGETGDYITDISKIKRDLN
jgi:hypothetical protein